MSRDTERRIPTVLLTGELGVVGGWLAVALLERGYQVRGTLRSLAGEAAVRAEIRQRVAEGERLSFVAADLQRDIGWIRAAAGCDLLLHVAAPSTRDAVSGVLRAAAVAGIQHVSLASLALVTSPISDDSMSSGEGRLGEARWTDIGAPAPESAASAMSLFRWLAPSFPRVTTPTPAAEATPKLALVQNAPGALGAAISNVRFERRHRGATNSVCSAVPT